MLREDAMDIRVPFGSYPLSCLYHYYYLDLGNVLMNLRQFSRLGFGSTGWGNSWCWWGCLRIQTVVRAGIKDYQGWRAWGSSKIFCWFCRQCWPATPRVLTDLSSWVVVDSSVPSQTAHRTEIHLLHFLLTSWGGWRPKKTSKKDVNQGNFQRTRKKLENNLIHGQKLGLWRRTGIFKDMYSTSELNRKASGLFWRGPKKITYPVMGATPRITQVKLNGSFYLEYVYA